MNELDIWRKVSYLSVDEAMNLIMGDLPRKHKYLSEKTIPEQAIPVFRAMVHDISQFKLLVYFDEKWIERGVHGFLPEPEAATEETICQFVSSEEYQQSGCWWARGKLAVNELRKWLRDKGFDSAFFGTQFINTPDYLNPELAEHSYKLAAAIKAWEYFFRNPDLIVRSSLKQLIKDWLEENAAELNLLKPDGDINKQAIEEVAKIVNWQTEGGAPKSI